jgi:hypothetical protein
MAPLWGLHAGPVPLPQPVLANLTLCLQTINTCLPWAMGVQARDAVVAILPQIADTMVDILELSPPNLFLLPTHAPDYNRHSPSGSSPSSSAHGQQKRGSRGAGAARSTPQQTLLSAAVDKRSIEAVDWRGVLYNALACFHRALHLYELHSPGKFRGTLLVMSSKNCLVVNKNSWANARTVSAPSRVLVTKSVVPPSALC